MSNIQSDTPRTDAEALKSRPPFCFVPREFAAQLERELFYCEGKRRNEWWASGQVAKMLRKERDEEWRKRVAAETEQEALEDERTDLRMSVAELADELDEARAENERLREAVAKVQSLVMRHGERKLVCRVTLEAVGRIVTEAIAATANHK